MQVYRIMNETIEAPNSSVRGLSPEHPQQPAVPLTSLEQEIRAA